MYVRFCRSLVVTMLVMYESYQTIKFLHVLAVSLSLSMFMIRSCMLLVSKGNYTHRFWRLITAFNDSLLLILGVFLTYINPGLWHMPWFQEKIIVLLLYIILGTLGLNRLQHLNTRKLCLMLAMLCAVWMLNLALYKSAYLLN